MKHLTLNNNFVIIFFFLFLNNLCFLLFLVGAILILYFYINKGGYNKISQVLFFTFFLWTLNQELKTDLP